LEAIVQAIIASSSCSIASFFDTGNTFSDRAVQMIRDHEVEIPLFLYIALHNTHAPVESPPEYCGLYDHNQSKQNMYYGQVTFVDHTVANITEMLRAKNLWENTLFIWTTDK
jgi:arylsulfatase A-like enzyme